MVPDRLSVAAVVLLATGALLLANPLYLQEDDRGNQFVQVESTSPAEGVASRSPEAEPIEQLPIVARYAAGGAIEDGSFAIDRRAPPLALQLLESEWRYVGSHRGDRVYVPTVTVGANETTVEFDPVDVEAVEAELGVTPPGGLETAEGPRRIIWLSEQTGAVVFVGSFRNSWERRLASAVSAGELTVSNGNNASAVEPLGESVTFVVDGQTPHRVTVTQRDESVTVRPEPVSTQSLLAETDVTAVETGDLSLATREVVVAAIESEENTHRFDGEDVDVNEVEALTDAVVRHEGEYYVLYRSHADDFSVLPLVRMVLWVLGGIIGSIGIVVGYRTWGRSAHLTEP